MATVVESHRSRTQTIRVRHIVWNVGTVPIVVPSSVEGRIVSEWLVLDVRAPAVVKVEKVPKELKIDLVAKL